jgi:heat shock protein HtpX
LPDLYYLAAPESMNAYALGGPDGAAIVLTEGLLRGMTPGEVAGILAHEVAHISNNDAWAMNWAAALHRAIEWTSLTGLAVLRTQAASAGDRWLRCCAPRRRSASCCVSRSPHARAGCGCDRTRAHGNLRKGWSPRSTSWSAIIPAPGCPVAAFEDGSTRLLRSHPATSERGCSAPAHALTQRAPGPSWFNILK